MAELKFRGAYARGANLFARQIHIPGDSEFTKTIKGWPAVVHPGTMNVKISPDGFPQELISRFGSKSVKHFDSRLFKPIIELTANVIGGNTLLPTETEPSRGNGQIWGTTITEQKSQNKMDCWVFRRIGSGYTDVLECVAGESISTALRLKHEDLVTVVMYGSWADS